MSGKYIVSLNQNELLVHEFNSTSQWTQQMVKLAVTASEKMWL